MLTSRVWYPWGESFGSDTETTPAKPLLLVVQQIDAVVLQFKSEDTRRTVELGQLTPEVWITAYPAPHESKQLVLEEAE